MQKININDRKAKCESCGSSLSDVTKFMFVKKEASEPTYFEEQYMCKSCHAAFIMHYDLFDKNGHVLSRVFVEDINDESYNWQDVLTDEQRKAISEHLNSCPKCLDKLSQEMLTDAWLKSYVTELREKK